MYIMNLSAYGNIDRGENPYRKICPDAVITGDSIPDMQSQYRAYIRKRNLGASNINLVKVKNAETGEVVGTISYNGRFWPV